MKIINSKLKDVYLIELEKKEDERGFFLRTWDKKIFEKAGLDVNVVQCNLSLTKKKGTIRGLHYQEYPFGETKLIRCTHGKIYSVIIDLRSESDTYLKWEGVILDAKEYLLRYIPKGFANGIQALEDNSQLFYHVSQFYTAEAEKGIRWDDPTFGINWPLEPTVISEKDRMWEKLNVKKKN